MIGLLQKCCISFSSLCLINWQLSAYFFDGHDCDVCGYTGAVKTVTDYSGGWMDVSVLFCHFHKCTCQLFYFLHSEHFVPHAIMKLNFNGN